MLASIVGFECRLIVNVWAKAVCFVFIIVKLTVQIEISRPYWFHRNSNKLQSFDSITHQLTTNTRMIIKVLEIIKTDSRALIVHE